MPQASLLPEDSSANLLKYLGVASAVCSDRSSIDAMRNVSFKEKRMQAFDGVVRFQAPSGFAAEAEFAVSGAKLNAALAALPDQEGVAVSVMDKHLRFKRGKLSVKVRKLDLPDQVLFARIKMSKQACKAGNFLDKLRAVKEFMSEDASRLWSVSVLVKDGHLWATNNLSLVRAKTDLGIDPKEPILLPAAAVRVLCELPKIDYFERTSDNSILVSSDKALFAFPQHAGEWPDLSKFFDKKPKKLPAIPEDMLIGSQVAQKFSERFTSLNSTKIESKGDLAEVEYEVDTLKGKGRYSARLLTLILSHATHADFSLYPDPMFFANEHIEGTAVGMREETAQEAEQ